MSSIAPVVPHPFADVNYLQSVVGCLTMARQEKQIGVSEVARKARVKEATIHRAERGESIPCTHEFRAWSLALGLSWEQVWTLSLPR
ncbi:MAG: XRE family transcriptional regulator [Verrucomicrobiaceae bacterium]|nr:MAG: XRE family transcriptional regulator [Verrucomicrobiaceae bacterium]